MVIPLRKQATDEHHQTASQRYCAVWGAEGTSLADARRAVRTLLDRAGHQPGHTASLDAQIVVSELVTNALRHAPGPGGLLLELAPGAHSLRITVRDSSPRLPQPVTHTAHRIGGHGLHLVARLCDRFHAVPLGRGKQVIAEFRLHRAHV
ncbi:ATP-binding protein [Streptomyces sp. NPDC007905]|uniref:ATP-binding protein n=1 Tax=Streptomyces sp. NPDC007905 TaxID=3364788 RepID=UPI0036EF01B9